MKEISSFSVGSKVLISIMFILIVFVIPLVLALLINEYRKKNFDNELTDKFKIRTASLVSMLKDKSKGEYLLYSILMIARRIIFCVIIVFLDFEAGTSPQIFCLFCLQMWFLNYVLAHDPIDSESGSSLVKFNEVMIMFFMYLLIPFTDFTDYDYGNDYTNKYAIEEMKL